MKKRGFTLVEMLMALLIVSVILSASLPVITSRQNAQMQQYNRYNSFPIGGIIVWGSEKPLPDNTWLECNGQVIPNGIEYEEIKKIYGTNLPDYRGVFLRGYGTTTHTQNNGTTVGNTATTHSSGAVGELQGDAIRNASGGLAIHWYFIIDSSGVFSNIASTSHILLHPPIQEFPAASGFSTTLFNLGNQIPTSNEIRPVNKAVRYIIKVRR